MGQIYRGIPPKIALDMKDKFSLKNFVETGTHVGRTALWASAYFDKVFTIELDKEYCDKSVGLFHRSKINNIRLFRGDSSIVLAGVLEEVPSPALIWLDAHWSRDLSYSKPKIICPVLKELECILNDRRNHVIMIDDYRLFGQISGWPLVQELNGILLNAGRTVREEYDVLISEPCLQ